MCVDNMYSKPSTLLVCTTVRSIVYSAYSVPTKRGEKKKCTIRFIDFHSHLLFPSERVCCLLKMWHPNWTPNKIDETADARKTPLTLQHKTMENFVCFLSAGKHRLCNCTMAVSTDKLARKGGLFLGFMTVWKLLSLFLWTPFPSRRFG
jgi:hypothetical protein